MVNSQLAITTSILMLACIKVIYKVETTAAHILAKDTIFPIYNTIKNAIRGITTYQAF